MQMDVQVQIEQFYCKLYDHRECQDTLEDIKSFLEDTALPQVTAKKNESLNSLIFESEVKAFLFILNDNKAPGTSGLTPAYYKEIWDYTGNTKTGHNCSNSKK